MQNGPYRKLSGSYGTCDWDCVYACEVFEDYEKLLSSCKKIYRKIPKERWNDLDACVDYAIETGNHAAFTQFYLKKACDQYQVFGLTILDLFDQYGIKKTDYAKWSIIKNTYWTKKNIPNYFEKEYTCNNKTLYSWINESENRMPEKYEIVQIGLYMGLSCRETNKLLEAAGKELLYIINSIDAICMFYLDFYHKTKEHSIDATEKICKVKKMIDSWTEEDGLLWEQPFTEGFSEKVSELKKKVSSSGNSLKAEGEELAFYLTRCYEKKFRECAEEKDFSSFIENYDFGILHYGYTTKTQEFMNNKKFKKNLYTPDIELKAEVNAYDLDRFQRRKNLSFFNEDMEKFYNKVCEGKDLKENDVVWMLNAIWKISWIRSDCGYIDRFPSRNGFSKVKEMVYGRNILKADKKRNEELAKTKKAAYEFSVKNKENLIQFCVACGMEDYLGVYMRLGNYWTEDYFKHGLSGYMERKNVFIIYAMKYRDALISRWCAVMKKKYPDKNEIEFQNQIKENFPFLQLMLIINRDIQFISSQIENKNAKNLKRIKNDLIYPVEYRTDNFETKKMWYLEYG